MQLFDDLIKNTLSLLRTEEITMLSPAEKAWELLPRNTFLMERDTAIELGGYPAESINLILPSGHLSRLLAEAAAIQADRSDTVSDPDTGGICSTAAPGPVPGRRSSAGAEADATQAGLVKSLPGTEESSVRAETDATQTGSERFLPGTEEAPHRGRSLPTDSQEQAHGTSALQGAERSSRRFFTRRRNNAPEIPDSPSQAQNGSLLCNGLYCIGNPALLKETKARKKVPVSFGKILLVETTGDLPEESFYDFTQELLLTDASLYLRDVMLRQSPAHYNLNLRVGKKAMQAGFSLPAMAETIRQQFLALPRVQAVTLILLIGDSPLYRALLPIAEKARELTLTLNHIFDGIDMDCGSCDFNALCDEVEGLRELHMRRRF